MFGHRHMEGCTDGEVHLRRARLTLCHFLHNQIQVVRVQRGTPQKKIETSLQSIFWLTLIVTKAGNAGTRAVRYPHRSHLAFRRRELVYDGIKMHGIYQ